MPAFGASVSVHSGFKRALNSIWSDVSGALSALQYPIFLTGHSLGAALAVLASLRCTPRAVYTFGAPRVGDARLAEKLRTTSIHRVVNGDDLITTLPLELAGFRHVGSEQRIGRTRGLPARDDMQTWNLLAAPPRFIADHAPINYVEAL